jgi:hypothetical protein
VGEIHRGLKNLKGCVFRWGRGVGTVPNIIHPLPSASLKAWETFTDQLNTPGQLILYIWDSIQQAHLSLKKNEEGIGL